MTIARIKALAKSEIHGRRLILMTGFILLLVLWTSLLQLFISIFGYENVLSIFNVFSKGKTAFAWEYFLFPFIFIFLYITASIFRASYYWFGLDFLKKEEELINIFQGLKKENIKQLMSLVIIKNLLILMWSLLFFIPGIWKAYLYSQAVNNLKTSPELTPLEAINKSQEQMKGLLLDYFILQVTFIPWYVIPITLVVYFFQSNWKEIEIALELGGEAAKLSMSYIMLILVAFGIVLLAFSLYVEPYKMVSKQIFYKEITNPKNRPSASNK